MFAGYLGSTGLAVNLERILPGAGAWLLLLGFVVFVIFLFRASRIKEKPSEIMIYFAILGAISFLIGGLTWLILVVCLVSVIWAVVRYGWKRAERIPARGRALEKRYFPEEERAREQIKAAEEMIEKRERKAAPEEAGLAEEEKEVEIVEEEVDVLVAAGEDFAVKVQQIVESEKSGETKEKELLAALSGIGDAIEKNLSGMGSIESIDRAGKPTVLSLVRSMSQICKQIVANENEINKNRLQFVSNLVDDFNTVLDVTDHAKKLSKGAVQIEKKLAKGLGAATIAKIKSLLNAKKAQLRNLKVKLLAAKVAKNAALIQQLETQIAELEIEISDIKQVLADVRMMKFQLSITLSEIGRIIREIRGAIMVVIGAEKKATAHIKDLGKFQSAFSTGIDRLEVASASFAKDVGELEKTEIEVAEQLIVDATTGVGGVFTEVMNLQNNTTTFYTEEVLPFIDDMTDILRDSEVIEPLMKGLHDGLGKASQGFEALRSAAEKVLGSIPSSEEKTFSGLQNSIEQLAVRDEQERIRITNQAMSLLQRSKTEVQNLINTVGSAYQTAVSNERRLLDELTRALKAIVSNKARMSSEFKAQAGVFMARMSEAQKTIEVARKAA